MKRLLGRSRSLLGYASSSVCKSRPGVSYSTHRRRGGEDIYSGFSRFNSDFVGGCKSLNGKNMNRIQVRSINLYAAGGASATFEPLSIWSDDSNLIKSWKFESDSNIGGNSDCTVSEEILTAENGVTEKVLRLSGKLEKQMDGKTPLMNMPLYSVFVSALGEFPKTLNLEGYVAFRIVMKPTNFSNITLNCKVEPHNKSYMIQAPINVNLEKEGKDFREYIVPFSFMNFVNEYGHRTDSKYSADDMKLVQIGFLLADLNPKPSQWTKSYTLDIKSITALNEQDLINCIQPWKFGKKIKPIIVGTPT
jgi:hypothetical protein